MSKKKVDKTYIITPKGLIAFATPKNSHIWEDIQLFCYRHGYNAILVNRDGGEFIRIETEETK